MGVWRMGRPRPPGGPWRGRQQGYTPSPSVSIWEPCFSYPRQYWLVFVCVSIDGASSIFQQLEFVGFILSWSAFPPKGFYCFMLAYYWVSVSCRNKIKKNRPICSWMSLGTTHSKWQWMSYFRKIFQLESHKLPWHLNAFLHFFFLRWIPLSQKPGNSSFSRRTGWQWTIWLIIKHQIPVCLRRRVNTSCKFPHTPREYPAIPPLTTRGTP